MPEKIVFSYRAFLSLVCETAEHLNTETGGLFLGYRYENHWYILETIDPGPAAILRPAYFEYEKPYVDHLLNKQARLYTPLPSVLGLWHRHPGSFDRFSDTDNHTNLEFVKECGPTIISALVNIDPSFRLTVYQTDSSLRYQVVGYEVEKPLSGDYLTDYNNILASMINGYDYTHSVDRIRAERILDILSKIRPSEDNNAPNEVSQLLPVGVWLEEYLKIAEEDVTYLSTNGITVSLSLVNEMRLNADLRGPGSEDIRLSIGFESKENEILITIGQYSGKYTPGTLKNAVEIATNV